MSPSVIHPAPVLSFLTSGPSVPHSPSLPVFPAVSGFDTGLRSQVDVRSRVSATTTQMILVPGQPAVLVLDSVSSL